MKKGTRIRPWLRLALVALPFPYVIASLFTLLLARNPGWLSMMETLLIFPVITAGVACFWLWKKGKRLRTRSDKEAGSLVLVFMGMTWLLSNVLIQLALYAAWGKVIEAQTADDILQERPAVYYTLREFKPDTNRLTANVEVRAAERGGSPKWEFFFAMGLESSPEPEKGSVWVGKSYKRNIPRDLSRTEQDSLFHEKYTECAGRFVKMIYDTTLYFKRVDQKSTQLGYLKGIQNRFPDWKGGLKELVVLEPQQGSLASRKLPGAFWAGIVMAVLFFGIILRVSYNKLVWSLEPLPESAASTRLPGSRRPRLPWEKGFVWQFLALCMGIPFLIMGFQGGNFSAFTSSELIEWGALYEPAIRDGEIWRMFTALFLHTGIRHLAVNMAVLYLLYRLLGKLMPDAIFLLLFLAAGLVGNVVSVWANDPAFSVGASGGLMGIAGVSLCLRLFGDKELDTKNGIFGYVVLITAATLVLGNAVGGDFAGHAGGLLGGIFLGIPLALLRRSKQRAGTTGT